MRSGVLAPVCVEGNDVGESREDAALEIVVLRCRFVVSVEGGGGRWLGSVAEERVEARQRKHSPVPK